MPARRVLIGAAVAASFVGAAVYGTVSFAQSINDDLRKPVVTSPRAGDVPAVPDPLRDACATDAPRNGPPANSAVSATDSTGEVKLYRVRSKDHVVTVPVSVTNTGNTRALYTVTVSVTLTGDNAGVDVDNAVAVDGAVTPHTTTSTGVSFTGIGSVPLTDMDVRVLDVRKQRCPAT
ncbi:hypothetical protein SSP24_33430 [Streptomyces spinoverrucosus]|uniref:Uncharacterized protein n=1 Tax=Streptomyces spinoverrucosus TaxID=284043 RepID=A0A4Y3VHV0_9ACTN|nr:hypothetical protein [Streptomyces spinoverrucosus]GEC05688.1 hypothetical protein SSP24_33430 [Streptomyces spinoverrucosus]GHB78113.1 hypothetical protein GCM10010397_55940 [Streptomyces spinoverrucosus]